MGMNEIVAFVYLPIGGLFIVYLWIPSNIYNEIFWLFSMKPAEGTYCLVMIS